MAKSKTLNAFRVQFQSLTKKKRVKYASCIVLARDGVEAMDYAAIEMDLKLKHVISSERVNSPEEKVYVAGK